MADSNSLFYGKGSCEFNQTLLNLCELVWQKKSSLKTEPELVITPSSQEPGPYFNINTVLPGMGIPMLKIRQSQDHFIFNMGIPILVRQHLYIEVGLYFLEEAWYRPWPGDSHKLQKEDKEMFNSSPPWTKWPSFRRRYIQMHFCEWKLLYFD